MVHVLGDQGLEGSAQVAIDLQLNAETEAVVAMGSPQPIEDAQRCDRKGLDLFRGDVLQGGVDAIEQNPGRFLVSLPKSTTSSKVSPCSRPSLDPNGWLCSMVRPGQARC